MSAMPKIVNDALAADRGAQFLRRWIVKVLEDKAIPLSDFWEEEKRFYGALEQQVTTTVIERSSVDEYITSGANEGLPIEVSFVAVYEYREQILTDIAFASTASR